MPAPPLAEFAKTFDRTQLQPRLQEAEQQRLAFISRFPREQFPNLSLARYIGPDGLCDWLDTKTNLLGDVADNRPLNPEGIDALRGTGLWKREGGNLETAEKEWPLLRDALSRSLDYAAQGRWQDAGNENNPLNSIPATRRNKLLHLYFPAELLPLYKSTLIKQGLDAFGLEAREGAWSPLRNRDLLQHLQSMPDLRDWSTLELGELLTRWLAESSPKKVTNMELIIRAMRRLHSRGLVWITPDDVDAEVRQIAERAIGDIATEMDDMRTDENRPPTRKPNKSPKWRVLERHAKERTYRLMDVMRAATDDEDPSEMTEMTPPPAPAALNSILYGPPGTGKTYSVIRRAAMLASGRELSDDEAKQAYDDLCKAGRIRLTTFHQSFSYEDFIEGIRPVMDEEGGAARFEVRDGVFKEIATEALFACLERTETHPARAAFETHWEALLSRIDETGELEIPGLRDVTWVLSTTEKGNVKAENKVTKKPLACGRSAIAKVWQDLNPRDRVASMDISRSLGKGAHFGVIAAVYNYMQSTKDAVARNTDAAPPSFESRSGGSKESIVQQHLELGLTSGWQLRADKVFPPYVLIIDEINRGNISRIFGELITLIEDDKRYGSSNGLIVTLPTSRQPFTVPPNLYLLGTMNTADKSLALLDVALRRRFEFEELAPNFALCSKFPALRPVMEELNSRLELRKDRDHRIGHAFFMDVSSVTEFNAVFRRKVVPLLQEYFFNDIDGARYVLGEANSSSSIGFLRPLHGEAKWQRNRWRWFTDVEPGMDCWTRLTANYTGDHA